MKYLIGIIGGGVAMFFIQSTPFVNCLPVSRLEISQALGQRDALIKEVSERLEALEGKKK